MLVKYLSAIFTLLSCLICQGQVYYGIGSNFSFEEIAPSNAVSMEWTILVEQGAGHESVDVDNTPALIITPGGYSASGHDTASPGEVFDYSASGNRETIITATFTTEPTPEPCVSALAATALVMFIFLTKKGKHHEQK